MRRLRRRIFASGLSGQRQVHCRARHAGHHLVDVAAAAGVGHLAARAADRGAAHGGLLRVRGGPVYPRGYADQPRRPPGEGAPRRGGHPATTRSDDRSRPWSRSADGSPVAEPPRGGLVLGGSSTSARGADRLPRRWRRRDPAQGRVDVAEALAAVAPVGVERRHLVGVAGHEVPPHEDRLRERDAAEHHQARGLADLDVDLGSPGSRGRRSAPGSRRCVGRPARRRRAAVRRGR